MITIHYEIPWWVIAIEAAIIVVMGILFWVTQR